MTQAKPTIALRRRWPEIPRGSAALERGKPGSVEAETLRGALPGETQRATAAEDQEAKVRERRRREIDVAPPRAKTLKGEKLKRASRRERGGDTAPRQRTPKRSKALKAGGRDGNVAPRNAMRARGRRRGDTAAAEGKALKGENPRSACRVKQTDGARRGESRQEGEKP